MINANIVDAVKVQFIQPIFEDDFPERGMRAWLTDVEWDNGHDCYKLYFDFSDFEAENEKYFKCHYYENRHTTEIAAATGRSLFTAREAGYYTPKYSVFFSVEDMLKRDDAAFADEIKRFLREVE